MTVAPASFAQDPNISVMLALGTGGRGAEVKPQFVCNVSGAMTGGGTALYGSVCKAASHAGKPRAVDVLDGEQRLYGFVVPSDGVDTADTVTQDEMFGCLPAGEGVEGVKFFTIAYSSDADKALLAQIAERTLGKAYTADPDTIDKVYLDISAQ